MWFGGVSIFPGTELSRKNRALGVILIRMLMGIFVLLPAWHALVFLRNGTVLLDLELEGGAQLDSLWVILYVMFVVWERMSGLILLVVRLK